MSFVFDYLPSDQIKVGRLVCKTWASEGFVSLRKRRLKILVSTVDTIKNWMRQENTGNLINIKIGPEFGRKNSVILPFFKKFGKSIVCLELCHPSWSGYVSLRKFLSENVPNLESLCLELSPPESGYGHIPTWNAQHPAHQLYSLRKLKTLRFSIDYSNYWSIVEQESIKLFLRHLLSGMPNLEAISCPKYAENFVETFQYEVQMLFRASPNTRPLICLLSEPNSGLHLPKLKNIDIPLKFWVDIPELQKRNYPLQVLDWFIGIEVNEDELRDFLMHIRETLKVLSIDFTTAGRFLREVEYEPCNSFYCLQNFVKLEYLSLRSFKGSLAFVLQIPSLRKLHLTKSRELETAFDIRDFNGSVIYSSLLSLSIDQHDPKDAISGSAMRRVGTTFPNLRKLEIRFLSDSSFRSVCQYFPCLEELIAADGIFHDSAVTGISKKAFRMLSKKPFDVRLEKLTKKRQYPYIASLKQLKKLFLSSKYLTENSAYFGLVDCSQLRSLTIMGYGFSSASLCAIADKLTLSYFKTIYCSQLTVDAEAYIRKQMSQSQLSLNQLQPPLNTADIYRLGLFQTGTVPVRKRPIGTSADMEDMLIPRKRRRARKTYFSHRKSHSKRPRQERRYVYNNI